MNFTHPDQQRASKTEVLHAFSLLEHSAAIKILNAVPAPVLILNNNRQLVYGNKALWAEIGGRDTAEVLGARPGRLFGCTHAANAPHGCGTSAHCGECGALKAMLTSIAGHEATQEYRLLREINGEVSGLDLLVHTEPLSIEDRTFTILTLKDISHEKRRRYLERIFFHDIINTAGGARGLAEILHEEADDPTREDLSILLQSLTYLVDEIESQKTLQAAESHDITLSLGDMRSVDLLKELAGTFSRRREAEDRTIVLDEESLDVVFTSDGTLLRRVLANMIKNALEAIAPGQAVTLSCATQGESVLFRVHNPTVIPEHIRIQMFKRSVSSKGPSRGLGTFGMRLLTHNFLGGSITFSTSEEDGTVFTAALPLRGPRIP